MGLFSGELILGVKNKFRNVWAYFLRGLYTRGGGGETNFWGLLGFLGVLLKTWEIVSAKTKETNSLNSFKVEICKWVPRHCPCRYCKQYISGVGFSSVI